MASTFSTNLAIELIGTGDQAGSWGNTTNTNLGTLIEQAISGYVTQAVATGTDTTITIPNGATGVARNMYIELTGTGGTNTNLIVPANKKLYFIFNNSTGAVTVKVSGQTGVSVPTGKKMVLVSNGTDIVNGLNYIADFGTNSFTVTNLTATSASITTLTGTSANITTLSGTTATFTSATVTNLALTSLTLSNLSIASANITTLTGTSANITNVSAASLTVTTGNLTFSSTGQRITGDFSNATASNRLFFQTSTTNGNSFVGNMPNGTGSYGAYVSYNGSDPANSSSFLQGITSTDARLVSTAAGTGSLLPLTFYTGGSERMRLDTSGNLGIGVTPSANTTSKLFNSGDFTRVGASGGYLFNLYYSITNARWEYAGTGTGAGWIDSGSGNYTFQSTGSTSGTAGAAATALTERMRIDSSGNVGIGTASPGQKLQVSGAIMGVNGYADGLYLQNATSGSYNRFILGQTAAAGAYIYTDAPGGVASALPLSFWTSGARRMDIDSSGNVGIGTASPASLLDLTGNDPTLRLTDNAGSPTGTYSMRSSDGNYLIRDVTNSTDRMRITSTGNLLVGTTTDVASRSGTISDISGNVRAIPRVGSAKTAVYTLSITDVGQYVELGTGGAIDVPNAIFSTGDVVSVFNNTTGARTISLTITTAYLAGTDADKASVSLATRGVATILFISNSVCVVTGNVS